MYICYTALVLALLAAPSVFACTYSVENPNRKNTNVEADFLNAIDSDASMVFLQNCYKILPDPNHRHRKVMGNDPLLMLAINRMEKRGNSDVVDWLLALGADVNITSNEGYTPLMLAAQSGHIKIIKALLSKGANIKARSKTGNTVLMLTWGTNAETARVLIDAGAELNAQSTNGMTALSINAHHDTTEVVSELLRQKANPEIADSDGMTALMEAARKGHAGSIKLLLAAGADHKLRDKSGKTALDWAKRSKKTAAIQLLEAK